MAIPEHLKKMWGKPLPHRVVYAVIDPNDLRGRVIRCANYNTNTLSVYNWCWAPDLSRARKPKFMEALRESINAEGVRNPIIAYSISGELYLSFGGSRALAARELGVLQLPAIINVYDDRFSDGAIVTPDNIGEFYTDLPSNFEFSPYGFEQHYGLERNRRKTFDPAGTAWTANLDDTSFLEEEFEWLREYDTEE
jgi:hypothetical protein